MSKDALFTSDSGNVTQSDFEKKLTSLGITKGDIVMVHSDIGTFGKLAMLDKKKLLGSLVAAIQNVIGNEGTLLMPTFTNSFVKNEAYDPKTSQSTVGVLTNFFREQKDVVRTDHPTHSFAIWGKEKKFFSTIGNGTFDEASVFGLFHKKNGKFIAFGTTVGGSCTFLHYIENIFKVPYRYTDKLSGEIIENGKKVRREINFDFRMFLFDVNFDDFDHYLEQNKLLKKISVGNGSISVCDANTLFDEGMKELKKNTYLFVKRDTLFLKIVTSLLYPFIKYSNKPKIAIYKLLASMFRKLKN